MAWTLLQFPLWVYIWDSKLARQSSLCLRQPSQYLLKSFFFKSKTKLNRSSISRTNSRTLKSNGLQSLRTVIAVVAQALWDQHLPIGTRTTQDNGKRRRSLGSTRRVQLDRPSIHVRGFGHRRACSVWVVFARFPGARPQDTRFRLQPVSIRLSVQWAGWHRTFFARCARLSKSFPVRQWSCSAWISTRISAIGIIKIHMHLTRKILSPIIIHVLYFEQGFLCVYLALNACAWRVHDHLVCHGGLHLCFVCRHINCRRRISQVRYQFDNVVDANLYGWHGKLVHRHYGLE